MNTPRAIYIIANTPTAERIEELSNHASSEHFGGEPCTARISHELPEGQPTHVADQLETKKNSTPGAVYLIVEPENF